MHIIKRQIVIETHLIELGYWKIGEILPGLPMVECLIQTSIASGKEVVWIIGNKGQSVIVGMFMCFSDGIKSFAAIIGYTHPHIHLIDAVELMGACVDLLIIVRACASACVAAAFFPALALICRSVESVLFPIGLYGCVDHIGFDRGNIQPDLSHVSFREPHFQPSP